MSIANFSQLTIFAYLAVDTTQESGFISIIKLIGPALIAAIVTITAIFINKWLQNREINKKGGVDKYKIDVEQILKQREFLIEENQNLWDTLKEELEACRVERAALDSTIEGIKKKLSKIELEIQAWELGLKTPSGFRLVKDTGSKG